VFLAGDAAHVHFPLGGQALSTGIEDAVNLGWKLAADVQGWAPKELLDSYHDERHPVGARACMTTRAQVAVMHPLEKVAPLRDVLTELFQFEEVNDYLVKMAAGLDIQYTFEYPGSAGTVAHPLLGWRLPDIALKTATGVSGVAQALHAGRGVLLDFSGGAAVELDGWADRVDVVAAEPTTEIDATAVLLRPDGRVAWAHGDDAAGYAGLLAALAMWFGVPD
jgi:hypothetical protein